MSHAWQIVSEGVARTDDPVRDLTAMGAAYVSAAVADPDQYRVMFDDGFALEDPAQADETLVPPRTRHHSRKGRVAVPSRGRPTRASHAELGDRTWPDPPDHYRSAAPYR